MEVEDGDERLIRIITRLVERGGYHEKGGNTWTAGIGATLLVAFILGGWSLSNQLAASQAQGQAQQVSTQRQIDDMKTEIQDLKRIIEQRYHS